MLLWPLKFWAFLWLTQRERERESIFQNLMEPQNRWRNVSNDTFVVKINSTPFYLSPFLLDSLLWRDADAHKGQCKMGRGNANPVRHVKKGSKKEAKQIETNYVPFHPCILDGNVSVFRLKN